MWSNLGSVPDSGVQWERATMSVALIWVLVLSGGLQPFQVLMHAMAPQRQERPSRPKPIAPPAAVPGGRCLLPLASGQGFLQGRLPTATSSACLPPCSGHQETQAPTSDRGSDPRTGDRQERPRRIGVRAAQSAERLRQGRSRCGTEVDVEAAASQRPTRRRLHDRHVPDSRWIFPMTTVSVGASLANGGLALFRWRSA